MATEPIDSLRDLINAKGLKAGNKILNSSGAVTGSGYQLASDSNGELAIADATTGTLVHAQQSSTTGAVPPLRVEQADVSEEMARFKGSATADVLTQTIVAGASVTTATKAGFIRVHITDTGDVMTDGYYYLEVFTLA